MKGARIGAIGARITPFKAVRFSEKLLEASGISVETIDLSEIITAVGKLKGSDLQVQSKLKFLCRNGFEHHVAISQSKSAEVLFEAIDNYLGWDVYLHQG